MSRKCIKRIDKNITSHKLFASKHSCDNLRDNVLQVALPYSSIYQQTLVSEWYKESYIFQVNSCISVEIREMKYVYGSHVVVFSMVITWLVQSLSVNPEEFEWIACISWICVHKVSRLRLWKMSVGANVQQRKAPKMDACFIAYTLLQFLMWHGYMVSTPCSLFHDNHSSFPEQKLYFADGSIF